VSERPKALLLDANGFHWKHIAADTTVQGLLRVKDYGTLPKSFSRVRILRGLTPRYESLSYIGDWRQAFCESPALNARVCNITNLADYATCLLSIRQFDLVVVLHSAAGDSMSFLSKTAGWFRRRRGKLVVFIGNEYDLMAEKLDFLRASKADYVCSQLPLESARWLYGASGVTDVLPMPHALNPKVYYPPARSDRSIDLGFIGALYPFFIGDIERTRFIRDVQSFGAGWGLDCDIREHTVDREEWAAFLRRCKGGIGAESGSYYLDRRGEIIATAKAFLKEHPETSFDELFERFFKKPSVEHVSGKCISSRHFEAIGTGTCQILLEGQYNGILQAGEHFISVKKDLSNIDEAIRLFKDDAYRQEIAERAYEHVINGHTYAHRIRALLEAVGCG